MNLNELRQDASATLRIPQHISLAPARARRTYIAGPMTGYPDFNYPAFNAAAAQLRAAGIAAINPADHGVVPGAAWEDYLRSDLAQLATCESIYFLPGWSKSRGALLEHHIATALGMRMLFADGAETPQAVRLRDELVAVGSWAWLRGDISGVPTRFEPIGGQQATYIQRDDVLGWIDEGEKRAALAATGKQQVGEVHPDDLAVEAFAAAMKAKMAESRAKGRGGWEDRTQCSPDDLSRMLRDHLEKGDPRDVANFCMMLHQRGEAIVPQTMQVPDNQIVRQILGRPNFGCIELVGMLRMRGDDIPPRAEAEQAAVLLFLLNCYLELPDRWHDNVRDKLRRIDEACEALTDAQAVQP